MNHDAQSVKSLLGVPGNVERVYTALGFETRRQGDQLRGICIFHPNGERDSLSIDSSTGLFHCHACKAQGDVFDAVQYIKGVDFAEAVNIAGSILGASSASAKPATSKKPRPTGPIDKVYSYIDPDSGKVRHETVRYRDPKEFKQRVPTDQPGVYKWSLKDTTTILYRLAEVRAAIKAGEPVYIAEGEKDALSLAGIGLCGTTSPMGAGVGKWKDSYSEDLRGAKVIILPDNDADGEKHAQAVAGSLRGRAQKVKIVRLPGLPDKGDISDFLAAGGTREKLLLLASQTPVEPEIAEAEAKEPASEEDLSYQETPQGLIWHKPTQSGPVKVPLANFTARIVSDISEDDGAQVRRSFEIEAKRSGRIFRFQVAASAFQQMNWPVEHMGATAAIRPGQGIKDHVRYAIQTLSGEVPESHVFGHTGWREVAPGQWAYLHADGAVGTDQSVQVSLPPSLSGFSLPSPPDGEERILAIRASMRLWQLAPDPISIPLFCGTWRAPLGGSDHIIHTSGPSGVFKTQEAALHQQHFGKNLDARHLPGSWSSTDNALEGLAFTLKDALCVIDDFAPTGTQQDVARLHARAERVIRGQGNGSGKGRMNADGTLRPTKYPRGMIRSTGEDNPQGQSIRARAWIEEITPGMIDPDRLSACQKDAADGLYASAMAGFLAWVAPQYQDIQQQLQADMLALRDLAQRGGQHRRTPGIVASLGAGLKIFLQFALEAGAITQEEREALWQRAWIALGASAEAQAQYQSSSEPTARYRELLASVLASGRAHLAGVHGTEPETPSAWGWRQKEIGAGESYRMEWQPQGERIGWIDGEDVYLEPDAAYGAAKKLGDASGDSLSIPAKTLHKRLHEKGLLSSAETERGTLTIRRMIDKQRQRVLHVRASLISAEAGNEDASIPSGETPDTVDYSAPGQFLEGNGQEIGQFIDPQNKKLPTNNGEKSGARDGGKQAAGQIGQIGQFSQTPYTPSFESNEEEMCQRAILGHLDTRCGQPEVTTGIVKAMEGVGFAPGVASEALRHLQDAGQVMRTASGFVVSSASPLIDG